MKKNKTNKYFKQYILQMYGYLALIPFVFGFLSLKNDFTIIDIIIFSSGLLFVLILIIINHLEPTIRVTEEKIILYNTFNNRPITLLINDYISYTKINNCKIILNFIDNNYEIKLNRTDIKKFIMFLEEIS